MNWRWFMSLWGLRIFHPVVYLVLGSMGVAVLAMLVLGWVSSLREATVLREEVCCVRLSCAFPRTAQFYRKKTCCEVLQLVTPFHSGVVRVP